MPETDKGAPSTLAASRTELLEVLVVEDETIARTELKRVLKRSGFRVREASSGREAIREMNSGEVGVVLMDLVLDNGLNGIDAAREIQQSHPDTSVIFISAYAQESHYQQRAQKDVIHIAGWIEKPIHVQIPQLVEKLDIELIKVKIRGALQNVPVKDRAGRLSAMARQDASISPEILKSVLDEFRRTQKAPTSPPESSMISLSARIDAVYDEMQALITSNAGKPGFGEALAALREHLRALQEEEAEEIAKRYDAFFRPNLDEAKKLIQQARQILRKG